MKSTIITMAGALGLAACSAQAPTKQPAATAAQRPSDAESEAYMRKAEADWSDLAFKNNPGLTERILADDYVGVNSDTAVRDKAKMIALANEKPTGTYVSSKLHYVHQRHLRNT